MKPNKTRDDLLCGVDDSRTNQVAFSSGRALLLVALIAALTGVVLFPFYRASAAGAHASVEAMESSFPLAITRGAHHWASALLILGGSGYLLFGLFRGSYRRPHQIAWIAAVLLVCVFLLCQLTGHLLPWDMAGVRTAAIETGIAENMPMIGQAQARMLRGGDTVGPRTLSIWFVAHVFLLPLVMTGLGVLILLPTRRKGRGRAVEPRLIALVSAIILIPALLLPTPLGVRATPLDYQSYDALPEWYVLPLHSLLKMAQNIHPNLAFVGTAVIPGLVLAVLLTLPWLDLHVRRQLETRLVRVAAATGVAGLLVLCIMSAKDMAPIIKTTRERALQAQTATALTVSMRDPVGAAKGRAIFEKTGCLNCHAIGGKGRAIAPPLDGEGERHPSLDWQLRHLIAPSTEVRGSTMPSYRQLKDGDRRSLAIYLLSL